MHLQNTVSVITGLIAVWLSLVKLSQGWLFPSWGTTCYDIGCFPTSYPYNNTRGIAPESPSTVDVRFYLPNLAGQMQIFSLRNAQEIMNNSYNPSAKTSIIIHGYMEHASRRWILVMANQLLQKRGTQVVLVDWYAGANSLIYFQSVANTRIVGAVVALFLQELMALGGDPSSFHVIGFSLGAHAAGYAGSRVRGLGRITGLDPAGPSFEGYPTETRLDPSDAVLVDVIHTDSAPYSGMGTLQPMGTVDFYPNGGIDQPGCPTSMIDRVSTAISSFDFASYSYGYTFACSHARANRLFSASINRDCSYTLRLCPTLYHLSMDNCTSCEPEACPVMGYNLDPGSLRPGAYLFRTQTAGSWPYC